jgi:predicted Zn-dependent protease
MAQDGILAWLSRRRSRTAVVMTGLLLAAVLIAACGSSSKSSYASSTAQVKQTCKHLEAVLSDGPEPEADPVGYAQAQVLPLRQIHTTDAKLEQAIEGLASAYQDFSASNGSSSAKSAVSAASKTIKTLCPGIEL